MIVVVPTSAFKPGTGPAKPIHIVLYLRRNRLQVLERKLMCLETFNNIYKALDQMRSSSVVPDTETNEEMRQRVTEECKWFVNKFILLSNHFSISQPTNQPTNQSISQTISQ